MLVVTPATMDKYHKWVAAAVADKWCRRFYWNNGAWCWDVACPDGEWNKLSIVNEDGTAMGQIGFDRSDGTATIGIAAVGENGEREARVGCVLRELAFLLLTRPVRRVFTAVAVTNDASMKLNRRIFGEPYGLSPETSWDGELRRWVDRALFSATVDELAKRAS